MLDDLAKAAIEIVAQVGLEAACDAVFASAGENSAEPGSEIKKVPGALSEYVRQMGDCHSRSE